MIPSVFPTRAAVLTTDILGLGAMVVIVGSLVVFPSVSSPSSETSVTSTPLGSMPLAEALLVSPPASTIA